MDFNCIVKLYQHQTGLVLAGNVYNTAGITMGCTASFTELSGGEYLCLVQGLTAPFYGNARFSISGGAFQTSTTIELPDNLDTQIDAIASALASTGEVTLVTPFVTPTDLELIQGESYTGSNRLLYTSSDWNLTTQTLSFNFIDNQTGATGPSISPSLAITSTTGFALYINSSGSAALELGTDRYAYCVRANDSGELETLVKGSISVINDT